MGGGILLYRHFSWRKFYYRKIIVNFQGGGGGGGGGRRGSDYYGGKLLFDSNLRAMINKRNQVSLLFFISLFSVVVLLINNDLDC